jgi:hypothetical protein
MRVVERTTFDAVESKRAVNAIFEELTVGVDVEVDVDVEVEVQLEAAGLV